MSPKRFDQSRPLRLNNAETYVRAVLARYAPGYLEFGDRLLRQALALATEEATKRYDAPLTGTFWSDSKWSKERVSMDAFLQTLAKRKGLQGPLLFARDSFERRGHAASRQASRRWRALALAITARDMAPNDRPRRHL
jgi:hypothetical protein